MENEQLHQFELAAGFSMGDLYMLIGGFMLALYGILMILLLKGSLGGWSKKRISAYDLGSRMMRLIFLFNILIFIVVVT